MIIYCQDCHREKEALSPRLVQSGRISGRGDRNRRLHGGLKFTGKAKGLICSREARKRRRMEMG